MKNIIPLLIAIIVLHVCCNRNHPDLSGKPLENDTVTGIVLADTIIYDVHLVNHNPDDHWATQRLKNLNLKLMIDNVYEQVYSGQAQAFNHTTGEKLTVKQVRELEQTSGLGRENVDMIQFREIWYMDPVDRSITKKVTAMVLGSQVYDSFGQYLANRAIMRVEFASN